MLGPSDITSAGPSRTHFAQFIGTVRAWQPAQCSGIHTYHGESMKLFLGGASNPDRGGAAAAKRPQHFTTFLVSVSLADRLLIYLENGGSHGEGQLLADPPVPRDTTQGNRTWNATGEFAAVRGSSGSTNSATDLEIRVPGGRRDAESASCDHPGTRPVAC